MDIITTHVNTDLDALASMVAAQKLYPEALLVMPDKLAPEVEEFLSLYKDVLNTYTLKEINLAQVNRVILVDTRRPRWSDKLDALLSRPEIEIHIYDHHPPAEGDFQGTVEVFEPVGATTTILVERIKKEKIPLTALEATILALGIYCDTGSLTFNGTTSFDAGVVAFLLAQGANLNVVKGFLSRPLSREQKALLRTLLFSAEYHHLAGCRILIAKAEVKKFIADLAVLTHLILDIEHCEAVFTIAAMKDRIYLVGRSNVPQINAGEIITFFGGGGHPTAASAIIKEGTVNQLAAKLFSVIKEKIRPSLTAADIMSSPVKTITPETTIKEAGGLMLRYGHTGFPVVAEDRLVGVISRRDIEKANYHGLGHARVKGFMGTHVTWVPPDLPVSQVQQIMTAHDIGRVPVVVNDRVIGIISRSDILRTLHGGESRRYANETMGRDTCAPIRNSKFEIRNSSLCRRPNIKALMHQNLNPSILDLLVKVGEIGTAMGYQVYVAGGTVRDILLGAINFDVDLVIEGDGIAFARAIAGLLKADYVRTHQKFGTAEIILPAGNKIDVATARLEFYAYPAALPQVEKASLHQDLYRRDFTINAMAVVLGGEHFGELIDYFGGQDDLKQGLIRVLYNLSFIEDPTRVLRAVRFEKRYDFQIESQTLQFLQEAVKRQMLLQVSCERLMTELKHILKEDEVCKMLIRLNELHVWPQVFPGVVFSGHLESVLVILPETLKLLKTWGASVPRETWFIYFMVLLVVEPETTHERVENLCRHYHLNKRQTEKIMVTRKHGPKVLSLFKQKSPLVNLSEPALALLSLPPEAHPILLAMLSEEWMQERFRLTLLSLQKNKPVINGKYIKSLGYRPGPLYRLALNALWRSRLDGQIKTLEEEMAFLKQYFELHKNAPASGIRHTTSEKEVSGA